MANLYVRSTDGSNVDNGSTWALAKATVAGAAAADSAGDVIYLSQSHSESTAGAVTVALAGTAASPTKVICGNDGAAPPTSVATTAIVATTGANSISITGVGLYIYGTTFNAGSGAVTAALSFGTSNGRTVLEECVLNLTGTSGGSIYPNGDGTTIEMNNCDVSFAASGQSLSAANRCSILWNGGSVVSGTTTTALMSVGHGATGRIIGVDLSAAGSTTHIFNSATLGSARGLVANCKLPASWTGNLVTGTLSEGARFELHNCDNGDTNYKMQVTDYAGSIIVEDVIKRTGGANDGTTGYSWKLISTANAEYPHIALATMELPALWNATVGSAVTVTVHTVTDNVTLTDAECWLEVQYLGTSGFPLGSFVSDAKADVLATAANQTTSSETWTTTGLTTPVKQQLSVTFTPQEAGYIQAVVKFAKASSTVYVCPKMVKS